jgi:PTS system mannose-specific IID component
MEEQKANGADIDSETINAIKVSLMGPLAGLGDSIFQAAIIPILLAVGIAMGLEGNIAGPIIFTILVIGIIYPLDFWWFRKSYTVGKPLITNLMQSGLIKKVTQGASMVGLLAAGTLTARYISFDVLLQIPLSVGEPINVQTAILDRIAPNFLPILLVLGIWYALRKKVSTTKITIVIFVVGLALGFFGVI